MARPIQYGDPGVVDWWKDRMRGSAQVSFDPLGYLSRTPFFGAPYQSPWAGAPQSEGSGVLDWLSAPHGPQGVSFIGGGSAYTPIADRYYNPSAAAYTPIADRYYNPSAAAYTGGLPSPEVTTGPITARNYAPGVHAPALPASTSGGYFDQMAPGTVGYAGKPYPDAAYQARHGTGIGYQPPGQAPEGGEDSRYPGSDINYENLRALEQNLKEAGVTGNVVISNDPETGERIIVRRDGQGRILSFYRDPTSYQIQRAKYGGSTSIGYQRSKRRDWGRLTEGGGGHMFDFGGQDYKKQTKTNTNVDSGLPNWVVQMSNWRGI